MTEEVMALTQKLRSGKFPIKKGLFVVVKNFVVTTVIDRRKKGADG